MKQRLLLFIMAMLALAGKVKADELTVYDGTVTNGYVPVYGYYADAYLKSQFVIPADELAAMNGGTISAMSFYTSQASVTLSGTFQVLLKEISETALSGFVDTSDATLVYEGTVGVASNVMAIDFTSAYGYSGGNLLVSVYQTEVSSNYPTTTFYGETVTGASVQGHSYSSLDAITANQRDFIPKTTFTYTFGMVYNKPSGLTVTLTPGNGTIADLSWTENGTATNWVLEYATSSDFSDATTKNVSTTPSIQLTGLTPETTYYVHVKADYGGGNESDWTTAISFKPTNDYWLTVNDGTDTNGYVPVYGYYADGTSLSQFIIPASDLATIQWSTINTLTFYASQTSVDWSPAKFEVYVAEVANTTLDAMVDWSTMEKVMNAASLSISDNQMVVTFDNPYQYLGGNLLIGIKETTSGNYGTSTWYGVSQTGYTAMGNVFNKGTEYEQKQFLPKTTFSYLPGVAPSCFKPTGVTAKASHTSATISWTGDSDSYNVQYRTPAKNTTSFFDNFEDGLDQWTVYTKGESPQTNGWYTTDPSSGLGFDAHSGNYVASAWSWNNSSYDADNWLVTPQVELDGTLNFWVRTNAGYPDEYEVLLSTTGNDIADFTVTLQAMAPAPDTGDWEEVSIDLSSYGGAKGYIAIHHVSNDMNYLLIDDFGIVTGITPASAWTTVPTATTSAELTGLEMDSEYEYQVQGICLPSDESEWTVIASFTTLSENDKLFLAAGDWNVPGNWVPAGVPSTTNNAYIRAAVSIPSGVVATAKNIVIDGGSITLKDGAEMKTPSYVNVTMEKSIAGYGDGDGKFNLISSPASGGSASTEIDGLMEGDYDYFRFVRTMDLEWRSYALTSFDMTPGNGYLYANKENKTLKFTGETWPSIDNRLSMSVTYSDSYPMNMVLAGNPFTCTATLYYQDGSNNMTGTFYKMNATGDGFDMYDGYVSVAPGEAVLVEYGEDGYIYYESEDYGDGTKLGAADIPVLPQHGSTANVDAGPIVALANAADNSTAITDYNGKSVIAKLDGRTLYQDGSWNTMCLPFNVTVAGSPLDGATVKTLASTTTFDANTLTVAFEDAPATIPAGTPFIVKWASGSNITNPEFTYVTINNVASPETAFTGGSFIGNFSPVTLAANDYKKLYLGAANKLYWPSADVTVNSFRAYFNLPGATSAPNIVLDFGDGETTGIDVRSLTSDESGDWYTVDGRKLNGKPAAKGVYVNNGRKVVIK